MQRLQDPCASKGLDEVRLLFLPIQILSGLSLRDCKSRIVVGVGKIWRFFPRKHALKRAPISHERGGNKLFTGATKGKDFGNSLLLWLSLRERIDWGKISNAIPCFQLIAWGTLTSSLIYCHSTMWFIHCLAIGILGKKEALKRATSSLLSKRVTNPLLGQSLPFVGGFPVEEMSAGSFYQLSYRALRHGAINKSQLFLFLYLFFI